MGWSVSEHCEPNRKRNLFDKRLRRLRGAVKAGESSDHVAGAAEKLRLAALALIKAKRALIAEYPRRDPDGQQLQKLRLQKLREAEQWWLSLSIEAIVEKYAQADA